MRVFSKARTEKVMKALINGDESSLEEAKNIMSRFLLEFGEGVSENGEA